MKPSKSFPPKPESCEGLGQNITKDCIEILGRLGKVEETLRSCRAQIEPFPAEDRCHHDEGPSVFAMLTEIRGLADKLQIHADILFSKIGS